MNHKRSVLFFNVFFFILLIGLTIASKEIKTLSGFGLKPIEILSEIQKDTGKLQQAEPVPHHNQPGSPKSLVRDYLSYHGLINTGDQPTALYNFNAHLLELKKRKRKKIRIAYFGDSMIEGDLVTQDLRGLLQNIFGGSGVGFVPTNSIVASFRQTITQSYSPNWIDINFKTNDKESNPIFLSGHCFVSNSNSTVSFKAVNQKNLDNFTNIAVLYGKCPENTSIQINDQSYPLLSGNIFNSLELKVDHLKEIKLTEPSAGVPLYGAAFESDSGIVVDNFSFRGISGVELDQLNEDLIRQVQLQRPYDLLIFHYGPNLLFKPNLTDFSWYVKKMQPVLMKMKNAFPQTDILMISTADKGFNYDGEWHTAKGVQPLIDAQYKMATSIQAGFFNLYNAMGGEDAIVRWVNADTALANKDYTHATHRGAKKMAGLIYDAILKEYQLYVDEEKK